MTYIFRCFALAFALPLGALKAQEAPAGAAGVRVIAPRYMCATPEPWPCHRDVVVTLASIDSATKRKRIRPVAPPATQQDRTQDQGSVGASIGAGVGLGLAGFFAGAFTGSVLASGCTGDFCGLEPAFYGAAVGGTLGMALGVHLGNQRRGNFGLDFLSGAAVWGAGIGIAAASKWDQTTTVAAFVAVPIVQLATAVAVERAVGRSNARRLSLFVAPQLGGGTALGASVAF